MKDFLKRYCLLLILIFGLPIIILAGIIICLMQMGGIDRTALVTLTAAAFTYYGTVILATVTLLQNDKITKIEIRNLEIEETKARLEFHPVMEITNMLDGNGKPYAAKKLSHNGMEVMQIDNTEDVVYIELKNTGNSCAYDLSYYDFDYIFHKDENDPSGTGLQYEFRGHTIAELKDGSSILLTYFIDRKAHFEEEFDLCYTNRLGHSFYTPMYICSGGLDGKLFIQCGTGAQRTTPENN